MRITRVEGGRRGRRPRPTTLVAGAVAVLALVVVAEGFAVQGAMQRSARPNAFLPRPVVQAEPIGSGPAVEQPPVADVSETAPAPAEVREGSCIPAGRQAVLRPVADGSVRVWAASDRGDSVAGSLYVRVAFPSGDAGHQLFVDADVDRGTGMWSYQSRVSSAGWDLMVEQGTLYRHTGAGSEWAWIVVGGLRRTVHRDGVDLCLPVSALGGVRPDVRVAVAHADGWTPNAFLPGAPVVDPDPVLPEPVPVRDTVAFHYGYRPWAIDDCSDSSVRCAASRYAEHSHVVLGSGLEDPSHPSHALTRALIAEIRRRSPSTEVWGYISFIGSPDLDGDGRRDSIHTLADLAVRTASWKSMGATGIFLDEADLCDGAGCPLGPGGRVTLDRKRQVDMVRTVHRAGLAVLANAFAPMDVLGPVSGVATPLGRGAGGRPADAYLLENPTISGGRAAAGLDAAVGTAKIEIARRVRSASGIRMIAVDTASGPVTSGAEGAGAREAAAGLDAHGYTNPTYSSGGGALERNLPRP